MSRKHPYWILISGMLILGCGGMNPDDRAASSSSDAGDAADGSADAGDVGKPFLPWKVGNKWTYRVTDGPDVTTKVTTVGELEKVAGTGPNSDELANRVETGKGTDHTTSWQAQVGDRVIRYREQSFAKSTGDLELEEHWDPFKLHFDGSSAHIRKNATWLEEYEETKLKVGAAPQTASARDRWTVLAVDEEVTVPAGTFSALVVQKAGGSTLKKYYFVRGIGKVKEEGGQLEELVSFEVAP